MIEYKVYTDGAASKGNSSYGFLITVEDVILYAESHFVADATNQQMELTAISRACAHVFNLMKKNYDADGNCVLEDKCEILSDSAYCINCWIEDWWKTWLKNGWVNSKKQPVANKELWEELIPYFYHPYFSFIKVSGHSGDRWNDWVDKMVQTTKKTKKEYMFKYDVNTELLDVDMEPEWDNKFDNIKDLNNIAQRFEKIYDAISKE